MLQPSPEYLERLVDPVIEQKAIKIEQRHMTIKRRLLGAAALTLAFVVVPASFYAGDVRNNQELEASSNVGISVLGEPLDKINNTTAIVFLDGFGSIDADTLTDYMSRAIQPVVDGQLWSVNYNDAPLSYNDIADKIIKMANERGIDTISLVGYSAGGSIAAEVMDAISQKSSLRITSVGFISTPDGVSGLRFATKNQIGLVEAAKQIPGAEYSSAVRFILEMAFRAHNYDNAPNVVDKASGFITNWNHIQAEMNNQELPGAWLMSDEVLSIENANIKDRLDDISKISNTRVHPTIYYLGTAAPGYDAVVNNEKSAANIGEYAKQAKLPFFTANVPGAVHGSPYYDTDEYVKTLGSLKLKIQTSINNQTSIAYRNLLNERYKHAPKVVIAPQDSQTLVLPVDQ